MASWSLMWVRAGAGLGFPGCSGKESPADAGETGSIPGSGRSPGEGYNKSLQYSYLGNPRVRGAWQARAHGFAKSQTGLSHQTAKSKGAGPGSDQRAGLGGLPAA